MADEKPEPKWIKKLPRGAFIVIAILSFPFGIILGRLLWGIFVDFVLLAILNPYLLFIYIPIIYLACKKTIRQALKKDGIKGLILPANKLDRLIVNVYFISLCCLIWALLREYNDWYYYAEDEFFRFFLVWVFLFAPLFFYTRYLWFEKSRNRIFYGIFDKLKFNLKQFNTEVFNTTSNADELKKYADLKDQGIITEEEFQAKKKQLLDL